MAAQNGARGAGVMSRKDPSQRDLIRVIPWWWALASAIAALTASAVTTVVLLAIAHHNASLRIEAIKVGLSVLAGTGGAAALLLAFRRQWLSEHVARDTSHDATERRVAELYAKAVEQLGYGPPVRLGGLYSLERLAQDHREHRQTVTDVICAYLRMPFEPPTSASPAAPGSGPEPGTDAGSAMPGDTADSDSRQELQVRLAAQRILARHLTIPTDDTSTAAGLYWDGMRIDLSGAVLVDVDFSRCQLSQADFRGTHFRGDAWFFEARFRGDALFNRARFSGDADFSGSHCDGSAGFTGAQFARAARFIEVRFTEGAYFMRAWFAGNAEFSDAEFTDAADFNDAEFAGLAEFSEVHFSQANFTGAHFSANAFFRVTQFSSAAKFCGAQFSGRADFTEAQFSGDAVFTGVHFGRDIWLGGAQFSRSPNLQSARASLPGKHHEWPAGWRVEPSPDDSSQGRLVVEATKPATPAHADPSNRVRSP